MGLYDAMRDVLNIAQKADNIELYRKLLDLNAQVLELQTEVARLKKENTDLREKEDLSSLLIRHIESFITKKGDVIDLRYCSHCWDVDEKLVQLLCDEENGTFVCPHCKMQGIYDIQLYNSWQKKLIDDYSEATII